MDVILLIMAGSGLVLLYSAVKNYSPVDVMKAGLGGDAPAKDHYKCDTGGDTSGKADSGGILGKNTDKAPDKPTKFSDCDKICQKGKVGDIIAGQALERVKKCDECIKEVTKHQASQVPGALLGGNQPKGQSFSQAPSGRADPRSASQLAGKPPGIPQQASPGKKDSVLTKLRKRFFGW